MTSSATILKRVKHKASNERPPIQYRIQLVDQQSIDDTIAFMISHYLPRENLNKAVGSILNKKFIEEAKSIYREYLLEGISLAAFLEDENGEKGAMISCNVLFTERKGQEKSKIDTYSRPRQIIYKTGAAVRAVPDDVFIKYECSSFINCRGLTVAPEYESQGIGTEMLCTREELCKLINVPVSATIFTGQMSQRMAARVGYQLLSELDLTTFRIDGQIAIPDPDWPVIKWMAIRYL